MKTRTSMFLACGAALGASLLPFPSAEAGNGNADRIPDLPEGELILGGPGVGLNYRRIYKVPFSHQVDIGRFYRFTLTGIEARADADGVAGAYAYDGYMWDKAKKNNNGHGNNVDGVDSSNPGKSKQGEDTDPTVDDEIKGTSGDGTSGSTPGGSGANFVPGWWEFWARVNTIELRGLSFSTPKLHELSPLKRLYLDHPVVFREQDITLTWAGDGNSKDPDGHFYILGSAIKEPPVPFGQLRITQTAYQDGEQPPFNWDVVRE